MTGIERAGRVAVLVMALWAMVWGLPALAQAPGGVRLATLDVALWPEYDQPAMLVIYRGQVAAGVPLPAEISIRIPASVVGGKPHAVAGSDPSQNLLNLPYTVSAQDGWRLLSFTTAYSAFQVEFYDEMDLTGPERHYRLTWPGDLDVEQATLQLQEPFGARGFQATPAVEPGQRRDDGLIYHPANLGSLPAGRPLVIELAYTKTDARISVEALQLLPPVSTPLPAAPPSAFTLPGWVAVGIALGGGLVIAGIIWYLARRPEEQEDAPWALRDRRSRRGASPATRPAMARSRRRPLAPPPTSTITGYCTQCGRPLGADDLFCPQCGTRRRAEPM